MMRTTTKQTGQKKFKGYNGVGWGPEVNEGKLAVLIIALSEDYKSRRL